MLAIVVLLVSLGPFKAVAAVSGFVLILVMFEWPTVGLVGINLAGTDRRASLAAGMAICGAIGMLEYFVPRLAVGSDDDALRIGAVVDRASLQGVELRRITGGLGDSNWLAASVIAVLPINLYWWRLAQGRVGRSLVVGIAGLQLLALVLSYTRAGFLGLAVAGLIAFYVCGMFVHANYLKILWFMAGLAAAQRRVALTRTWSAGPAKQASEPGALAPDPVALPADPPVRP